MDEVVVGAISAVWHDDTDRARLWFQTIGVAYQDFADDDGVVAQAPPWTEFQESLRDAATAAFFDSTVVDTFVEHLQYATNPVDVARQLGDDAQLEEIVRLYQEAVDAYGADEEQADEPAEDVADTADTVEFDQDAWFVYLAQWDLGWDGTAEAWPDFVSGFRYHAPDGSRAVAATFIDQMEALSIPERITGLADFGIHVTGQPASAELPFDLATLMSELVDEAALAEAVESGLLHFEEIENDDLNLEAVA